VRDLDAATDAALEDRFPGYRSREPFEHEGFRGRVLVRERDVKSHACYVHGHEVGEDIEVLFRASVLLLPRPGAPGWCVLDLAGHSLRSERYDQDGRTVTCRLDDGRTLGLASGTHHQKPGRPCRDDVGDVAGFTDHLRGRMGYAATEEAAADLVTAFLRRYGG
jgi:hypothetical protein